MAVGTQPSYYCGTTNDLHSGAFVYVPGLDATGQLAAGQIVTAPVVTITNQGTGADMTSTMLVGGPSVGPNAQGVANTVVTCAVTNAVAGQWYRLLVEYVPSPPSPSGESLPLLLVLGCLY